MRRARPLTNLTSTMGGGTGMIVGAVVLWGMWCLVLPLPCSSSPIHINLKPAFLKDLLTRDSSSASKPSLSQKAVSIDLSGRYECFVRGRESDAVESPLIVTSHSPDVRIGFEYDVQSVPWFHTVFAKLQWRHLDWLVALEQQQHDNKNNNNNYYHPTSKTSALTTYVAIKPNPMAHFQVGGNTKRQGYILTRLIPHDRLSVEYKAHWNRQEVPPEVVLPTKVPGCQNDPEWWIPTMQISTAGRLEARNSYRLQNGGRISLHWSRSLGWLDHWDSTTTNLQLKWTQPWSAHHTTEATIRGMLCDLPSTARAAVVHRHFTSY